MAEHDQLRNYRPHPMHRHEFTDEHLAGLLEDWSTEGGVA